MCTFHHFTNHHVTFKSNVIFGFWPFLCYTFLTHINVGYYFSEIEGESEKKRSFYIDNS